MTTPESSPSVPAPAPSHIPFAEGMEVVFGGQIYKIANRAPNGDWNLETHAGNHVDTVHEKYLSHLPSPLTGGCGDF